jgi:8-oxo-dGTP pyrophosphatase MutT (NUDIX family)
MGTEDGDLTLKVNDSTLNIRVLLLIECPQGYIFESHEDGYYFAIGGRLKLNESSIDGAKRELQEEIEIDNIDLKMIGIIENFFVYKGEKAHEINFVYKGTLTEDLDLSKFHSDHLGFKYIKAKEAVSFDIKPKAILDILRTNEDFYRLINKDY